MHSVTPLTPNHVAIQAAIDGALAIYGHGFAEEGGNVEAPGGHHVFTTVSQVLLMNIGEDEIRERFMESFGDASLDVHVITDTYGNTTAYYGPEGLETIQAGYDRDVLKFAEWEDGILSEAD